MAEQSITVKVIREVSRSQLLGGPLRSFFEAGALELIGVAQTAGVVPIDRGTLRSSLSLGGGTSRVDRSDPPMFAIVGTNLDYGLALDDPSIRDPHYRSGPSRGNKTKGWLSERATDTFREGNWPSLLKMLARDLEEAWERG